MKSKIILCLAVVLSRGLFGCAHIQKNITVTRSEELPGLVGRRVTLVGIAYHNCPGAMLFERDKFCVFIDGMTYWPTNYDRRRVQVEGLLTEKHQPDLFVIRDATWKLVP